jgi:hypothetical protein
MHKGDHDHHVVGEGEDRIEYTDVPFVHQNHINLCGDAAAQMLIMCNGREANLDMKPNEGWGDTSWRLKRNPRGTFTGGDDRALADLLQAAGLHAYNICPRADRWTAQLVLSVLQTYGPYAQSVRFGVCGHWVVVTGTDGQDVFFNDPWRGRNKRKSIGEWVLKASADADGAVGAIDPGEPRPQEPFGIQANRIL